MVLLTIGFFVSTDILGTQDIQSDFKCKVIVFLYKVLRGLPIWATCLLSVLKAITIIPSSSCFTKFTLKSPNPILCFFLFLWILNNVATSRVSLQEALQKKRATQMILLLVSCFVIIYCVDFIISFSMVMTWANDPILVCIQMLAANGYGTVLRC
ncbi:vomeronasal type-1 receptor 5-like [Panthera pardus]|uniref:Vomeronasal type-1 receptor n=1 Tax=Panthera pardus TaxID=9691 RepID=A0A9W2V1V4_PANPR|nr:vomeronasal type-1 receptor 5-like [Panthera pardus]